MTQRAASGVFSRRGHWSYLFYAVTLLAVGGGLLSLEALADFSWPAWLYLLGALGLLSYGIVQRRKGEALDHWLWVLLSVTVAAVAASGGQLSPYYPLLYLFWVAAPTWLEDRSALLALLGAYLGLELALWWSSGTWLWFLEHLFFSALFLGTHRLVFGGYLRWLRKQQADSLAEQQRAYAQDAQDFRLAANAHPSSREFQSLASVASIHSTIDFELDLLRESIGVHSVLLLWPDRSQDPPVWQLKAHRASVALRTEPLTSAAGFLAPLLKGEPVMRICGGVQDRQRFFYRDPATPVQSICAVGVGSSEDLEGVLIADRLQARPFSEAEVGILQHAGQHLTRCLAQERAFAQTEAQKQMQVQLYAASVRLSQALGMAQLQESSLEALCMLLPNDLALLFMAQDEPGDSQTLALVAHRCGPAMDLGWQQCVQAWSHAPRVQSQAGMVGGVLKNRVKVMPNRPEAAREGWSVFGGSERILGAASVLALPLAHAEQCDAVAVFISRTPSAFAEQELRSAGILVNQIGAAMQNARLYDQMQRQATTDGLTGLANHRAFQSRLDESIAHSKRTGQPLSLILTDIDHFKKVNDTHGHLAGDALLRQLASLVRGRIRREDLFARVGGEEFAVLLRNPGDGVAAEVGERVRLAVGGLDLRGHGVDRISVSVGVAVAQGADEPIGQIVDRADRALYRAKRTGRDRVVSAA